jgi:anaerobic selenocysteine-containing dehydrogenase
LWDTDTVYSTPAKAGLRKSLERIPFIVAFATLPDETSTYADLILPDQTYFEHWDLVQPEVTAGSQTLSVVQPVIRPLHEARDRGDVLLELAARWGGKVHEKLPDADFNAYLKRHVQYSDVKGGSIASDDIDGFWEKFLQEGVWAEAPAHGVAPGIDLDAIQKPEPQPKSDAASQEFPLYLQPFASAGLGTGLEASLPWIQELPDPMNSVVWGSWVEIHPLTAAKLGIKDNEWVWVESPEGKARVPALLHPAARPDTVSIPFGQGHQGSGRYASGRGVNPWQILSPASVRDVGETAWAATRVRVTRTGEMASLVRLGVDRERTFTEIRR